MNKSFTDIAIAAFPDGFRAMAEQAAQILLPLVDEKYDYRRPSHPLNIPCRIHFLADANVIEPLFRSSPAVACLCSRSTDGYVRQAAIRRVLALNEPWAVPFIVLLAGEYVVEIIEDLVTSLPALDRDVYNNFVRNNRNFMRLLRERALSYWDCYYRNRYPKREMYPGLVFLHQLEIWAK